MKQFACRVCGGSDFVQHDVLWPELIEAWELSEQEAEYINRQQGFCCSICRNNLRSIALADSIIETVGGQGNLKEFVVGRIAKSIKLLEVNEAGGLSPYLSKMTHHLLAQYPEYDMMCLELPDRVFDLVVHSDTLEHVSDPLAALSECYRVLRDTGKCLFTVPVVVNRLSRSRAGLKNSYHGNEKTTFADYLVHNEFGADLWTYVLKAGFRSVEIIAFEYPSAIVISASK